MGFLSTFLPGFRDFRTPFASGCLWLTAFLLLFRFEFEEARQYNLFDRISSIAGLVPESAAVGALAFVAYLLGVIATFGGEMFTSLELRTKAVEWLRARKGGWRNIGDFMASPSAGAQNVLVNYVNDQTVGRSFLAKNAGYRILVGNLEIASLGLSASKPEQYQHYDRLRSEADFRNAIWLPILLILISCMALVPLSITVAILVPAIILLPLLKLQAVIKRADSDKVLAQAIYNDWTSVPAFSSFVATTGSSINFSNMNSEEQDRAQPEVQDAVAILKYFADRSMRAEARALLRDCEDSKVDIESVYEHLPKGALEFSQAIYDLDLGIIIGTFNVVPDDSAARRSRWWHKFRKP